MQLRPLPYREVKRKLEAAGFGIRDRNAYHNRAGTQGDCHRHLARNFETSGIDTRRVREPVRQARSM